MAIPRTISDAPQTDRTRVPNVLIILVTADGPERLRQCLAGLAKQTHPRIGILAVDDASTDGSADVLRSSLGPERVLTLPERRGFAAALGEGLRSEAADRADYVVFLSGDTQLAPDAVSAMVDAAERMDGVGVVGPKVLDASDPTVLREIGMSVDLFGHPYSPLEKGEIDQGQYDRIREVFYVTANAMLVSADTVARAGTPDERLGSDPGGMDFCWRARLAGFRVLWTPTAVALQPAGARARATKRLGSGPVYQRERGALAAVLKNDGFLTLLWLLPLAFGQMIVRVLYHLLARRFEDAYQILAAWGWNVVHLLGTGRRRARAQSVRSMPDRRIRQFMAPTLLRLNLWWRRFADTLREQDVTAPADAPRPSVAERVRAVSIAHPVAVAWVVGMIVAAVAYRHLLTASPLTGGALAGFPTSPRGFFGEFLSGLRHTALGGGAPASPALPMLGVASTLTFANPSLAQKVLLLALPILAAVGFYRAVRTIPVGPAAAVIGAACYALAPVTLWSLSEGRLPEAVYLAGLPWLAARLIWFFSSDPPRRQVRWIIGAAVGLAALGAFFPGVLLAAAIVALIAVIIPGGSGRVRGAGRVVLAVGASVVLALPVVIGIFASGGRSLADPTGPASFADVLRTAVGRAPGDWPLAFFLPIGAALGLGFASGTRARPAARSTLMALAGIYLAWAAANGWLPTSLSNPAAYAALAAFGMASLIAMGIDGVATGLPRRAVGGAQVASIAFAAIVAVGVCGQAMQAGRGAWEIGGRDRLAPAYAVVETDGGEAYRVLWLGAPTAEHLPPPGGVAMGSAGLGRSAVRFAVTAPAGASAYDMARPLSGSGLDQLTRTLGAILDGPTRHAGSLLAPYGIRYVVGAIGDLPDAVQTRFARQLDMVETAAGGLVVFRDTLTVPLAAVIRDPGWARAAATGDLKAEAAMQDPHAIPLAGSGGHWALPATTGQSFPPGSFVLLGQQAGPHWRLTSPGGGPALSPEAAFGWAVGFAYRPTDAGFTVTFAGQAQRTALVMLLSAVWLAALWITRRPSRAA